LLIYIASALSNAALNTRIAMILGELGHECFLPQRDAGNVSGQPPSEIAARNRAGIRQADCVVVIGLGLGNDTSWEIGYAKGIGKNSIMLCQGNDLVALEKSIMLRFSFDDIVVVESLSADERVKERLLHVLGFAKQPIGSKI
jgi:nucleoside 2-deoxyribosyltransferase